MRRFELFLVFGALFAVGWPALFGVRPRRGIVAGVLAVLFVAHWRIEGLRWQMIPLYALALGLVVGDLIVVERELAWTRRAARGLFGVAGVALAALLPLALPVPRLPIPPGPESIGTVTVELDVGDEIYGETPGGPRRLNVQVWYPAAGEASTPEVWNEDWDVVMPELATHLGMPSWFLNQTQYTTSHAGNAQPPASGTFPVVIYSHDWAGFRAIAPNQIETLVSNGYIVVAPDHTFGAIATRFADGEVARLDPAALPEEETVTEDVYDEAATQLLEVFAADIVGVIDALEQGSTGPFAAIADSADLTRVGIYGHGAGGGAAVAVCLVDERCDAVIGLDPWVEPLPDKVIAISAPRPAMYMRSDGWRGTDNDAVLRGLAQRSQDVTYWLGVAGAEHGDFVATPLVSPIAARLGLKGPIPAGRMIPIMDRYLSGFFDVFLLGTGPAAIDTASFEEVSVEVIQPG